MGLKLLILHVPLIKQLNKTININMTYFEKQTGDFIEGAHVTINGSGISDVLRSFGTENYSIPINTSLLNQGVNFFTIYAQNDTCLPQIVFITIEIVQTQTELRLYINGTRQSLTGVIVEADPFTPGDIYNITLEYIDIDQEPHVLIPDATVNLTGPGFSDKLLPNIHNNYSVILNSEDLNWGVNYLSILAQKTNYEPQTITIKFEVIAKNFYYFSI